MRKGTETLLAGALSIALAQLLLAQEVPGPSPAAARESVSAAQRVDALFAPWSKGDTPGAAVIVIRNGQVLFEKGYGLANLETRTPIRPDTAFLLASLTKQFTAMTVMMLAERGKIRYEDPLTRFFPHFPLYAQKITVRHLLNHTAGLPEYDDLWIRSGKVDHDWPRSSATRPSTFEPTSRDALNLLAQQKSPDFDPGEKWKYSNSGYVILAQIVEKASGTSFGAFLEENIFRPLGMKGSLLYDERKPKVPNVAKSYTRDGSAYREIDYTPLNKIYGEDNVYSTLDDMYKWDQALYGEKLVKASTLREAFTPGRLNDGTPTSYGFGWRLGRFLGLDRLSHGGSWLGFRTHILRFPEQRFTVVVLSNVSQLEPGRIAGKIGKIYLADKMTFPVAREVDASVLRGYVGKYEFAPGAVAEITFEDGVLWIKPPGEERTRLFGESQDVFFGEGMEEISLVFERDEKGAVVSFSAGGGNSARKLR